MLGQCDVAIAGTIARAFGLGRGARISGPVDEGRHGQIWLLTTNDGRYAVKRLKRRMTPEAAQRDAAYQDAVRAAGVPMPAVIRTSDGEVLYDVDGHQVRVYEWIDVLAPDRNVDPVELGTVLARAHQVEMPPDGPVREWFTEPVGAEAWESLVHRLRNEHAPFVDEVAALVPQFLALERQFEKPEQVRICHCDLWVDNVRRTPDGGLVLVDWENCGSESPSQELGLVVFEFGLGDHQRMLELYSAYLLAGGPGRLGRPGDLTMVGAACEHLAEESCRKWLAAQSATERTQGASVVSWLLSDPVTPAVVNDVLDAVAGLTSVPA